MAAPMGKNEREELFRLAIENDDEETIFFLLHDAIRPTTYVPDSPRFNLDSLTDEQCRIHFRFDKQAIQQLATKLHLPEKIVCPNRVVADRVEGLCILLRRFVYPNRLVDLESFFGRPKSSLSMIINCSLNHIFDGHEHLLSNLDQPWLINKLQMYADAIHQKGAPLVNCIGFIDGTVRPICRPTRNQRVCYNGHKRIHSLKFQSVVTPDGMIANMFGPVEGRRHDCALLRESGLMGRMEAAGLQDVNGIPFSLYGDPAYPVRNYLLSPFKGANITEEQQLFNRSMSSVREAVEWEFGRILSLFAFLDFRKNLKVLLQPVAKYYLVGALLKNCHTCLYSSQTSLYFAVDPPTLEEYLN